MELYANADINMKIRQDDMPTSSKIRFEDSDEEIEEDEEESASEDVSCVIRTYILNFH